MNTYVWTPTFPMDDHKESIGLLPIHAKPDTIKRELEPDFSPKPLSSAKRQRKSKTKTESSSSDDLNGDAPKDKGRGRYACLNHRMKHKRCPPDCKERRPKPMQSSDLSPESPSAGINIESSPQRNILQLEDNLTKPNPVSAPLAGSQYGHHAPLSAPVGLNPMQTVSALPSMADGCPVEWDSVEWENLMDDHGSQNNWPEVDNWDEPQHNAVHHHAVPQWEPDTAMETKSTAPVNGNPSEGIAKDYASVNVNGSSADGITLKSLLGNILLTRDVVERWIVEPYFNRLLQGFYVRVRIGEYMDTSVYRIARVEEVVDRAFFAYNLGKEQTTKGVVLQIGSTRKTFSLLSVSNKAPSDVDFQHWEDEMNKQKVNLSEDEVRQKEEIVRVMNLKYPSKMSNSSFASTSN